MKIQSLSIVVPNRNCINNCGFCVSHMRCDEYKNQMDTNLPFYDLYERDYIKRLEFARDNGCNTVMLTGNSEPQQNRSFLQRFGSMNSNLAKPFRWIEMQTTGVLLDEPYLRFLRNHVGISTISLSLSALNNAVNRRYNGTKESLQVDIEQLCASIKKYDFNLRLSLNLTDYFSFKTPEEIFASCKNLGADQVIFRVLYSSGQKTIQDLWIAEHSCDTQVILNIRDYILNHGRPLEILEFGSIRYSVNGISTVLDDDCMNTVPKKELKYLILRPDCKLYTKWDDPASLLF